MKKQLTFAIAFTFAAMTAGSAMACSFNKSASMEHDNLASMSTSEEPKTGEAMSTFDPNKLDTEIKVETTTEAETGE